MEKQLTNKRIINLTSHDGPLVITTDILSQIKEGDIINAGYEEPHYGSDSGHDGYHYFMVIKKVLETDEEFKQRKIDTQERKEKYRLKRYENYLKLKEEFDDE